MRDKRLLTITLAVFFVFIFASIACTPVSAAKTVVCNLYDRSDESMAADCADILSFILDEVMRSSQALDCVPRPDVEAYLRRQYEGVSVFELDKKIAWSIGKHFSSDYVVYGHIEGAERYKIVLQVLEVSGNKATKIDSQNYSIAELYQAVYELSQKALILLGGDRSGTGSLVSDTSFENHKRAYGLYRQAMEDDMRGDYPALIESLQKCLALIPEFPHGHLALGVGYLFLEEYDDAVGPLQKVSSLEPDYWVSKYLLSCALYNSNQVDSAISIMTNLVSGNDKYAFMPGLLGTMFYFGKNDTTTALQIFDKALRIAPVAEVRCNLGYHAYSTGAKDQAFREFRKACEIDPDCFPAHYYLMSMYLENGKKLDAFMEGEKCLSSSLDPALAAHVQRILAENGYQIAVDPETRQGVRKGATRVNPLLPKSDGDRIMEGRTKQEKWLVSMFIGYALPTLYDHGQ